MDLPTRSNAGRNSCRRKPPRGAPWGFRAPGCRSGPAGGHGQIDRLPERQEQGLHDGPRKHGQPLIRQRVGAQFKKFSGERVKTADRVLFDIAELGHRVEQTMHGGLRHGGDLSDFVERDACLGLLAQDLENRKELPGYAHEALVAPGLVKFLMLFSQCRGSVNTLQRNYKRIGREASTRDQRRQTVRKPISALAFGTTPVQEQLRNIFRIRLTGPAGRASLLTIQLSGWASAWIRGEAA